MPALPSFPRIALLGGGGLLGGAFRQAWAADPRVELVEFPRADLNLTRPDRIDAALDAVEFDLLVNCAAYTRVDDAEAHPDLAITVNAVAAGRLARHCARRGVPMVYFSTDYVFDGQRAEPWTEEDTPNPLSAYGKSKREGEVQVLEASPQHLVARLSWLFGPGREAFPEWVLRQACQRPELRLVADKTGCPTCNTDVVQWIEALLFRPDPVSGIVHLCNPPACTWQDYGQHVLDCAGAAGWPLRARRAVPVPLASLSGLSAPRPLQSALATERFTRLTGVVPRPWREALTAHVATLPRPVLTAPPGPFPPHFTENRGTF